MEKGLGKESAKPKQGSPLLLLLLLPRLGNLVVEAEAGAAVVAAGAMGVLLLLLPLGKSLVRGRVLKPRLLRKRKVWSKRGLLQRRKTCGEKMLTLIS